MHRRPAALAPVLALALAAGAGCGSSAGTPKSSTATDGRKIFQSVGCSSCHVLADAGASGHIGPDLDRLKPSLAAVVKQVTAGGGAMPSFKGTLSGAQIQAVSAYVADVAGS